MYPRIIELFIILPYIFSSDISIIFSPFLIFLYNSSVCIIIDISLCVISPLFESVNFNILFPILTTFCNSVLKYILFQNYIVYLKFQFLIKKIDFSLFKHKKLIEILKFNV